MLINTTLLVAISTIWVYAWPRRREGTAHEQQRQPEDHRGVRQPGVPLWVRLGGGIRLDAAGAGRGHRPDDLGEEERAAVHAGLAAARLPALAHPGACGRRASLGERQV